MFKASALSAGSPGFQSWINHTSDFTLVFSWLSCKGPGITRSVLRLVGLVSVYVMGGDSKFDMLCQSQCSKQPVTVSENICS